MKPTVLAAAVVAALLLAGVGLMYVYGTPQGSGPVAASPGASSSGSGASPPAGSGSPAESPPDADAAPGESQDGVIEGAEAPPPDPSTPLAIEIPGCVCHSDDPEVVEEHAQYRMNQCAGCHVGGTPTGQ